MKEINGGGQKFSAGYSTRPCLSVSLEFEWDTSAWVLSKLLCNGLAAGMKASQTTTFQETVDIPLQFQQ